MVHAYLVVVVLEWLVVVFAHLGGGWWWLAFSCILSFQTLEDVFTVKYFMVKFFTCEIFYIETNEA